MFLCNNRITGGWGWRLSFGLGGIPASMLTIGSLIVTDSPNSLIERGYLDEGKSVLRRIRGIENVEPEYNELVEASHVAKAVKAPVKDVLLRKYRPPLVIAILLQVSQCSSHNLIWIYIYIYIYISLTV